MSKLTGTSRRDRGFTLVELLTVIAIIGILAGMILPAVTRAKAKARVATTKQQMQTIVGAVGQYQAEYSRMPAFKKSRDSITPDTDRGFGSPDFTYGTASRQGNSVVPTLVNRRLQSLPSIGNVGNNGYQANNSEVITIMNAIAVLPTGQRTVNFNHALNPKKLAFMAGFKPVGSAQQLQAGKPPPVNGIGPDGVLRDVWGSPYIITLDLNYDGKSRDGFYRGTPGEGLQGLRRVRLNGPWEANGVAMVWSLGPDMSADAGLAGKLGVNKDNILSWD